MEQSSSEVSSTDAGRQFHIDAGCKRLRRGLAKVLRGVVVVHEVLNREIVGYDRAAIAQLSPIADQTE